VPTKAAFTALENQLEELCLSISDIERVILTHLHRDHIGLVDRIKEITPLVVIAHEKAEKIQQFWSEWDRDIYKEIRNEIRTLGGGEFLNLLSRYESAFRRPRPTLKIDKKLRDRDLIDLGISKLEAIWTPGHAREHICLYDSEREILFSGDHLLPKITSHISHHTYLEGDPLADYINSLDRIRRLPVEVILPGHEHIFYNLVDRISELEKHHKFRCEEIKSALIDEEKTVFEISALISWDSRPWPEMLFWTKRMAAAETYAHLVYMRNLGEVHERLHEDILYYGI
jgi:glyoxylase-like metal-dependent hydrolase (beta-lactamase superfamily II)